MDILAIIKDNLPEGVDVSDKTLKAIEKEIKAAQGLELVPKAQYAKKTERITELETELSDLQGKSADGESWKAKHDTLKGEFDTYKKTKETEITDLKTGYENEKTTAAKQSALRKQLVADGANQKLLDLLELKFDLASIELDGDKIKDWEKISKPIKEQYADIFTVTEQRGFEPGRPPSNNVGDVNPFTQEHFNLEKQTQLYRENPQLARQMAASVGIKIN